MEPLQGPSQRTPFVPVAAPPVAPETVLPEVRRHDERPVPQRRPPGLLRVVRTIIRADSDPARQTLFGRVVESRPLVGLVYRLHTWLGRSPAAAWLVSSYGLVAYVRVPDPPPRRVLCVASHENARRQVGTVMSWIGTADCGWVQTGHRDLLRLAWSAGASWRAFAKAFRIVRRVDTRWGFLVSCRVASAIAWYARSRAILSARRPGAVLVSSDANPEEAGFLGAARALAVPQVFVSHAYPTPFSPPLDFTLSILEGDAALAAHRAKAAIGGRVLLAGLEGDSMPMDASRLARRRPVIGIFPPKAFSWPTLAAIIDDCRAQFDAREIVMRWHPSTLEAPRLGQAISDTSRIVETDPRSHLSDIAARCDFVVAGENSNVHLPVMKLGIPTVVVKGLGLYTDNRSDLYGFVANGIVYPPVPRLRDVRADAVAAFFDAAWAQRFSTYDASYMRPPAEIGRAVRQAIVTLLTNETHSGGPRP